MGDIMEKLNNLDNIINSLSSNQVNLKPVFLLKNENLEVYYDIKYEGMYVLKFKTNSNYLKENQFIIDYFINYEDIVEYITTHYLDNIIFVEKVILEEIRNAKQYILDHCLSFKDVLDKLKISNRLYLDLSLEAYSLKLENPCLKYNVVEAQIDLLDDEILISSRFDIHRK